MPSGLSGYSTPRSGRRRQPPSSSGRRKFNPLERISDIFSPQTPDFSPLSSPIQAEVDPDDSSSFSGGSSTGEPFAEQVEHLSQLLATPSQQLGELALTTADKNYRSDDDMDDELEGLESSRRLLAEELSRVDYSLLGSRGGVDSTHESTGGAEGKSAAISPPPSPKRKEGKEKEKGIGWVPLLEVEARHPPNFSPAAVQPEDDAITSTGNNALSPTSIFTTPDSARIHSVSRDTTVFEGHEFYSPISTVDEGEEEEDKKPAAKDYSSPDKKDPPPSHDRKNPPPNYPNPDMKKLPTNYPSSDMKKPPPDYPSPDRKLPPPNYSSPDMKNPSPEYLSPDTKKPPAKKTFEGKNYSPLYTPPRPLSGGIKENVPKASGELGEMASKKSFEGKKQSPLYTPHRPLSGGSEEKIPIANMEVDQLTGNFSALTDSSNDEEDTDQQRETRTRTAPSVTEKSRQQSEAKLVESDTNSPVSGQVAKEDEEPNSLIPQLTDEDTSHSGEGLGEGSGNEAHSPESLIFDPFGFGPRGENHLSSVGTLSDLGEGSNSPSSSVRSSETAYQSFLAFARRFAEDGRSSKSNATPTKNVEHSMRVLEYLNTKFQHSENESRNEGRENLPNRGAVPANEAREVKEDTPVEKKERGDGIDVFVAPPRTKDPQGDIIQEPTKEIIFGNSASSLDSEISDVEQRKSHQEQMPILGPLPGSDSAFESSTGQSKSSTETKTISDGKESKSSKFEDTSIFVPIFSDDSEDENLFQKESTHSMFSHDIGAPAPGESNIEPDKPQKTKEQHCKDNRGSSKPKWYPSGWNKKNWLLALAMLLFVVGIGLVVGTVLLPGGGGTQAPSASVTISPTQEAKPSPTTLAPIPSFSPGRISSVPSWRPSANTRTPSSSLTSVPSLRPSAKTPMPSSSPTSIPSLRSSAKTLMPSFFPTGMPSVSPVRPAIITPMPSSINSFTVFPSENPSDFPSPNLSTFPSENPSTLPTHKGSEFPSALASISPASMPSFSPNGTSLVPSLKPSKNTPIPSNLSPSKQPTDEPSSSPIKKESEIPTRFPLTSPVSTPFSPSSMPLVPTLRPSAKASVPSSPEPSSEAPQEPSTSPTLKGSESPTTFNIISFTVPYKIFILNGLVEFVLQSEYVPELILSMDLLTVDILENIGSTKRIEEGRILTEVVLPTSIIEIFDAKCPDDIENSLCQEVIAEISLLSAEDSWQLFKDTTELAIEIGRLQFHLERVDKRSPVEIIDAEWEPPKKGKPSRNSTLAQNPEPSINPTVEPTPNPTKHPSSDIPIPVSAQRFPTIRPTIFPTPSDLFDFLGENSFDGGEALNQTSSPQYMAYSWLGDSEGTSEYSKEQLLQRYSMATLYYATNGDKWLNNISWMSDATECTWFGKTGSKERCNKKGELVNLELDLNNLSGSLPPELGLLSSALQTMTLSGGPDSALRGTLPTELGYLTLLEVFVVQNNDLSGIVPSEVGNWKKLKEIDLSQNGFRGDLPTQIGSLSDLKVFDVSNNKFSGSLPSELGQLKKCEKVFFEGNDLDSFLPIEIGDLKEVKTLKGGSNKFTSLPTELGKLKSAEFISFQNCSISGSIPTELGNLGKLRKLYGMMCSRSFLLIGGTQPFICLVILP